jgi:hypothetical protein
VSAPRADSPAWREVIFSLRHHGVIPANFVGHVAIHFTGNGTLPKYEIKETGQIALDVTPPTPVD